MSSVTPSHSQYSSAHSSANPVLPSVTSAYLRRRAQRRRFNARSLQRFRNLPGRFAAAALMLAVVGFASVAHARDVQESFFTGTEARLDLSNISGEISISGWDGDQVRVLAELDSNAEIEFKHNDQRVGVKVVKKPGLRRMGSSELEVLVPFASEISVYAVSADLEVKDVLGPQRLEVVSGDIRVANFASDLEVKSVSGDIDLIGSNSPARTTIVSVSGDTDVRAAAGELEASSVSGDTNIAGTEFDRVRLKSTSGSIEFAGALNASARLDAEAISGRLTIDLDGGDSLDVDIETFSGGIRSCTDEKSVRKNKYGPGRYLQFTRGAADRDVRVRSMSGSVEFCAR